MRTDELPMRRLLRLLMIPVTAEEDKSTEP